MNDRFINLPAFFYDDGLIWFHDLYINPFQIESVTEIDITYTNPEGENVESKGSSIMTKSGNEHDINMSPEDLLLIIG
jgi:hypothetical protein